MLKSMVIVQKRYPELYFPYLLKCFNHLVLALCSLHILFSLKFNPIYKKKENTLVETKKNYSSEQRLLQSDWWEEKGYSADVIGH